MMAVADRLDSRHGSTVTVEDIMAVADRLDMCRIPGLGTVGSEPVYIQATE